MFLDIYLTIGIFSDICELVHLVAKDVKPLFLNYIKNNASFTGNKHTTYLFRTKDPKNKVENFKILLKYSSDREYLLQYAYENDINLHLLLKALRNKNSELTNKLRDMIYTVKTEEGDIFCPPDYNQLAQYQFRPVNSLELKTMEALFEVALVKNTNINIKSINIEIYDVEGLNILLREGVVDHEDRFEYYEEHEGICLYKSSKLIIYPSEEFVMRSGSVREILARGDGRTRGWTNMTGLGPMWARGQLGPTGPMGPMGATGPVSVGGPPPILMGATGCSGDFPRSTVTNPHHTILTRSKVDRMSTFLLSYSSLRITVDRIENLKILHRDFIPKYINAITIENGTSWIFLDILKVINRPISYEELMLYFN